MSAGMAIGSAVMAGVMTAMSSYSSGSQAKNKTDAVGSGLGNALMGGLSGAVTGAMLGSVIPGIGTAIGAVVGAIGGVAVSAVSTTVGYISEEGQRAVDKAVALLDEYNQRISSIKANLSTLESLQSEFDRLSRGVSAYGENISLSADEYSRYRDIVEQIVGISPSLRIGFDEEGRSLAEKNGLLEKSIALLKEENRQKLEGMVSNDSLKTMLGKAKEEYKSAVKEFENIQMPSLIGFSGVKINSDGSKQGGFVNQIDKYIEDVIGIPKDTWESIPEYIKNNSEKINNALAEIKTRSMQYKDGWAGVSENTAQGIMDYIGEVLQGAKKIENVSKNLNPTLQLVPQTITAYDTMTSEQKKFITEYINGFQITSNTTDAEITDMSNSIKKFVDAVGNADVKESIGNFFSIDETKPAEDVRLLKEKYIAEIAKSLGKDPIEIQTMLGYDVSELDRIKNEIRKTLELSTTDTDQDIVYTLSTNVKLDELKEAQRLIAKITEKKGIDEGKTALDSINKIFDNKELIQNVRSLQSELDKGKISYSEYQSKLEELSKKFEDLNTTETFIKTFERIAPSFTTLSQIIAGFKDELTLLEIVEQNFGKELIGNTEELEKSLEKLEYRLFNVNAEAQRCHCLKIIL